MQELLAFRVPLEVLGRCRNLRSLSLSAVQVLEENVTAVSPLWPLLEKLEVDNRSLSDAILALFARNAPQLRNVDLSCELLTDVGLQHLADHCPLLEDLRLGLCYVTAAGMRHLAQRTAALRCLSCHLGEGVDVLAGFVDLGRGTEHLERLTILNRCEVGSLTTLAARGQLASLRSLSVACRVLTAALCEALTTRCPVLVELSLAQSRGTHFLAAHFPPHLTSLDVDAGEHIDEELLVRLASGCSAKLTHLSIDQCGRIEQQITEQPLLLLAHRCPALQSVAMHNFYGTCSDALLRIVLPAAAPLGALAVSPATWLLRGCFASAVAGLPQAGHADAVPRVAVGWHSEAAAGPASFAVPAGHRARFMNRMPKKWRPCVGTRPRGVFADMLLISIRSK